MTGFYKPRRSADELSYLHGRTIVSVPMTRRVVMRMLDLHDRMEQSAGHELTRGEVVSRLIELGAKTYEQRRETPEPNPVDPSPRNAVRARRAELREKRRLIELGAKAYEQRRGGSDSC